MARNSKKRHSRRPRAGLYGPRLDHPVETPTGGSWLRWRRRRHTRIRPVS